MGAAITITNSSSALESISYTYDEIYNRTSMTRDGVPVKLPAAFTNAAAYNAANRLTSFNGGTVLHDLNGNMTSWGNKTYVWDSRDRLVEIKEDSNTIAAFKYDALGRRVEKTINGNTTKYLYDGADIVMEMDGNNVATAYYVRTLNIDEPLARIDISTGEIRFYIADALGSVIALTDENGVVKTRYNYTPFGEVEVTGEASENPFMFTGREWDEGTGLYFYRARYYSPEMGRFISEDPIGLEGGINMYAYVGNSPVNFADPLGLLQAIWGGSWSAIVVEGAEGSVFGVLGSNTRLRSRSSETSKTFGLNVGGSLEVGLISDDLNKVAGKYTSLSWSIWFLSGSIIKNAAGEVVGGTVGLGLGLPYGISIAEGETKIDCILPETYEKLMFENVHLIH